MSTTTTYRIGIDRDKGRPVAMRDDDPRLNPASNWKWTFATFDEAQAFADDMVAREAECRAMGYGVGRYCGD